ncbi:MAG: rhamnulokinase family protein [Lachnospiraceae bacterium]|jgi:rhamnulokinase|nr:rhamnulokinase family protein [Lachnospiraceae bacterium]
MKDHYLILDLGASNGRAIVASVRGDEVEFDMVHRFDNRPVFANEEEYFWDILRLLSEVKIGIQKCWQKYGKVNSMAIDSWGCDFGMLDENGRLIGNPLHYRDRNQHERSEELHAILSEEELFALSGGPCNRIMGVYKLFSLMKMRSVEYEHGRYLLMIPDLLNYFLTGKPSNEFCNATMTLMANQRTRQWEPEILDRLGLHRDFLHPLTEPGTYLGMLKEEVCRELEVESIPVVIPATHDTASAVAGIPIRDTDRPWGYVSLGTWCLAGLETGEPLMDPEIVKLEFGNEGAACGKNLLIKNITGLWIIQQCRDKWKKDRDISWDEITLLAKESRPMKCVINVNEERFGEFQADMPGIIQAYCRKTGQEVPETIGEVADCIFRSLALMFAYSFERITDIVGATLELLHLVGGGTQNKLVCQYTANAVRVPVVAGPTETTAFGNLIFQMMADGKLDSLEEGRRLCAQNSELVSYQPEDAQVWSGLAECYRQIVEG